MRILYLTPYVPSLVRVRPFQLIRHLARLGHEVALICLARDGEELEALAELRRCCCDVVVIPASSRQALLNVLWSLPSSLPLQAAYGASPALTAEALRRADRFDVIHIEHLRGSAYAPPLRGFPLVLDAVDCISLLLERSLRLNPSAAARARALLDLSRTRKAEGRFGSLCSQVVVSSPEDRWALQQLQAPTVPAPEISVVPNGVDFEGFAPATAGSREPETLIFSGKMSYHANEAAALYLVQEIMPLIWRQRPQVRCKIVGRGPTSAVRALAADRRILVTGAVPSMAAELRRATLAVAPLRYAVGIQNKVLEALATATPVVATPQVVKAINARAGREIALAQTPQAFADTVLALLESPQQREELGAAGRRFVERQHDWCGSAARLVDIYRHAEQAA